MSRLSVSILATALLTTALPGTLLAQEAEKPANAVPAESYTLSPGGVDMRTGQFYYKNTDLALSGGEGMQLIRDNGSNEYNRSKPFGSFSHNWDVYLTQKPDGSSKYNQDTGRYTIGGFHISVHASGRSNTFSPSYIGGNMRLESTPNYAVLRSTLANGIRQYTYTAGDGTVITFMPAANASGIKTYASEIVEPNGRRYGLQYDTTSSGTKRLRRVTDSKGHLLVLEYGSTASELVSRACILNLAAIPAPATNACPSGGKFTAYSYHANGHLASFTDASGVIFQFSSTFSGAATNTYQTQFYKPGIPAPYLTNQIVRDLKMERVQSQTFADGRTFTYDWNTFYHNDESREIAGGSYSKAGGGTVYVEFSAYYLPGSDATQVGPGPSRIIDELGRATFGDYCSAATLTGGCFIVPVRSWTLPDGNRIEFTRDGMNNVTETRQKAKPGSGLPDIVTSAFFDCSAPVLCNKPVYRIDARGHRTDYTYDATHGGMLTETGPAVNGVRPQKRYTYQQRHAWTLGGTGYVRSANPIWLLAQESTCQNGAAFGAGCATASDEVKTLYDYGPDSGPNTLLLRGIEVTADGQYRRTCYRYDAQGNKIAETEPRAGLTACQ